ncbi:Beta-lactamase hydrolase-like protein [Thalassocella blandensis]|nr:Beta-lactamase hydrolase-like protein [Thalassocella blandensis]
MLFRQLFDASSSSYTYLIADPGTREAMLIDPVLEKIEDYLLLLEQLQLTLTKTCDTHTHADHITAQGKLCDLLNATSHAGMQSLADCAGKKFNEGDTLYVGTIAIQVMYTPGHTDDSYCFLIQDKKPYLLFSGDTLLIRGTGRTDFQNGDAIKQYASLQRLLSLPQDTIVYPGHDYKGWTQSTIAEEATFNPRLQHKTPQSYAAFMASLNLPNPRLMDVAVALNQACGKR